MRFGRCVVNRRDEYESVKSLGGLTVVGSEWRASGAKTKDRENRIPHPSSGNHAVSRVDT